MPLCYWSGFACALAALLLFLPLLLERQILTVHANDARQQVLGSTTDDLTTQTNLPLLLYLGQPSHRLPVQHAENAAQELAAFVEGEERRNHFVTPLDRLVADWIVEQINGGAQVKKSSLQQFRLLYAWLEVQQESSAVEEATRQSALDMLTTFLVDAVELGRQPHDAYATLRHDYKNLVDRMECAGVRTPFSMEEYAAFCLSQLAGMRGSSSFAP
ncbi:hypothetical protein THASP1DRAFT_23913 [Thamnocephalis sphaerospora]|uniref:Uncharacterized protein n=1 Tax=Thamnocephalis sphaerospora TaxID=78915 RepID=A0A4P9XPT9_9FUNG|nr:hypothetical protein THASP1DRAFT_23913 [Thamnocephalis sphaerospora]|eukprot:RKP08026.1 hypothetical protein THASP1DRAFT_23913 [Thamnocephalis sphaerospora]